MPEQFPENELEINQLAKRALRCLKVSPDPGELYLIQVMQVALDRGWLEFQMPSQTKYVLLENFNNLCTWSPAGVMKLFLEDSDGYPIEIYPPGPVNPRQLAAEAFEQLHSRLTAALAGYPIASPRD